MAGGPDFTTHIHGTIMDPITLSAAMRIMDVLTTVMDTMILMDSETLIVMVAATESETVGIALHT